MKNKYLYILLAIVFIIAGCCKKPISVLPSRHVDNLRQSSDTLNSPKNEIAPYMRVATRFCYEAYFKEFAAKDYYSPALNRVKPSSFFFKDLLGEEFAAKHSKTIDYLTNSLESVTFLTHNSGFVSLSHAPDTAFTNIVSLPFYGTIGGTDIFIFNQENGKYVFRAMPDLINSEFWDSHPWVGQDSSCNLVLIWSSDRDNPYSVTRSLDKKTLRTGNADLFYSFRINNVWMPPVKFQTTTGINTDKYNEISPFVACMTISPRLFFSSDRDGDFDIYECDIEIDFTQRAIKVKNEPRMLPKGSQYDFSADYINTEADELFPLLAFPYKSAGQELFVSSNRNNLPTKISRDSLLISKGKFDLYMFNYQFECKLPPPPPPPPPPVATLKVNINDASFAGREVLKPIIKLIDAQSGKEMIRNSSVAEFKLEHGREYDVFGGSEHNTLYCEEPGDSLIKYYKAIRIDKLEPLITKREVVTEYDSIANPTLMIAYDTTYVTEIMPLRQATAINTNNEAADESPQQTEQEQTTIAASNIVGFNLIECPPRTMPAKATAAGLPTTISEDEREAESEFIPGPHVEIERQIISKREWYEGGKVIAKSFKTVVYDTLPRYDTVMVNAIGAVAKSELTHLGKIYIPKSSRDTTINDIIQLEPVFFVKPKCSVDFVDIKHEYNKNVPYFQTAFWLVNTSAALERQLQAFEDGGYLQTAGFIELHPNHRRYGTWNSAARARRLRLYREYAVDVDKNLRGMRDEILEHFIPAMDELLTLSPETKLLIKLEAYSDRRPADLCYYIGGDIEYIQGKVDNNGKISLVQEKIQRNASLNADNENLSKLRVYYGFRELFSMLMNAQNKNFQKYMESGEIFYPTQNFGSEKEMLAALEKARIIILTEGKYYDKVIKDDVEEYDPVRRLNLHIRLIQFSDKKVVLSPCCSPE